MNHKQPAGGACNVIEIVSLTRICGKQACLVNNAAVFVATLSRVVAFEY